jgi:anti-anti-sigma factor
MNRRGGHGVKIDRFQHGSVQVFVPHGPVTEDETSTLRDTVTAQNDCPRIVLSLREVPYFDSQGIELLLDLSDQFYASGGRLRLAEVDECCSEILHLTGHLEEFEIHETIDGAVRSLL